MEGGGGTEPLLLQLSLLAVLGGRGGDICGRWKEIQSQLKPIYTPNCLSEAAEPLKLFASVLIPFEDIHVAVSLHPLSWYTQHNQTSYPEVKRSEAIEATN